MHAMGFAHFALVYGAILYLLIAEASILASEGTMFLVMDGGMRLIGGLFFAVAALLPYVLASAGCRKVGHVSWFLILAVCVFVVHTWLAVDATFLASSSTAVLGLLFFPAYLSVPILLLWGILRFARERRTK